MAIGNPTALGTNENSNFVTTLAVAGCVVPSNSLVVVPIGHSGSASIVDPTGISDGTNALTKLGAGVTRSNENVSIWYRYYTVGATLTFTASFSSSSLSSMGVYSILSADSATPADEYGTSSNFDTAPTATTAGTCDQADEVAFQLLMVSGTAAFSAWPSTGYTSLINTIGDGSRAHRFGVAYKNGVTAAATETPTATLASSLDWVQAVATFRGAAVVPSLPEGQGRVRRNVVAVQRSANY